MSLYAYLFGWSFEQAFGGAFDDADASHAFGGDVDAAAQAFGDADDAFSDAADAFGGPDANSGTQPKNEGGAELQAAFDAFGQEGDPSAAFGDANANASSQPAADGFDAFPSS